MGKFRIGLIKNSFYILCEDDHVWANVRWNKIVWTKKKIWGENSRVYSIYQYYSSDDQRLMRSFQDNFVEVVILYL